MGQKQKLPQDGKVKTGKSGNIETSKSSRGFSIATRKKGGPAGRQIWKAAENANTIPNTKKATRTNRRQVGGLVKQSRDWKN